MSSCSDLTFQNMYCLYRSFSPCTHAHAPTHTHTRKMLLWLICAWMLASFLAVLGNRCALRVTEVSPSYSRQRVKRHPNLYKKKLASRFYIIPISWGWFGVFKLIIFLEQLLYASMLDIILDVEDGTMKDSSQCFPIMHVLTREQTIQHNYNTVECTSQ